MPLHIHANLSISPGQHHVSPGMRKIVVNIRPALDIWFAEFILPNLIIIRCKQGFQQSRCRYAAQFIFLPQIAFSPELSLLGSFLIKALIHTIIGRRNICAYNPDHRSSSKLPQQPFLIYLLFVVTFPHTNACLSRYILSPETRNSSKRVLAHYPWRARFWSPGQDRDIPLLPGKLLPCIDPSSFC